MSKISLGCGGKLKNDSGRFIEYLLDREDVKEPWKDHTEHVFVEQMADGTLPIEKFKTYLIQDYLFLVKREIPMQLQNI